MDPWLETTTPVINNTPQTFEDNFKPSFEHLPDSEQYLALLESKLERIKNDPNVLQQLADKREACMQQLLTSCSEYIDENQQFDTPINNSTILRTIVPERTAINQGEIVKLVHYDQLHNESDKEE